MLPTLAVLVLACASHSAVRRAPSHTGASRVQSLEVPPPPPPVVGVAFSGAFTDYAVLQRATAATSRVAVYGFCGVVGNQLTANQVTGVCTYQEGASVEVVLQGFAPTRSRIEPDGTWKALLPAQPAGGSYTVSAACTAGCGNSSATILRNITFGDVYFCSGQSNMWLPMEHTFSRNDSVSAIEAGKYHNIRMMTAISLASQQPVYVTNRSALGGDDPNFRAGKGLSPGGSAWTTAAQMASGISPGTHNAWGGYTFAYNQSSLNLYSATCFYFAQSLTDLIGEEVPLGLITSAWGGTMIESWMDNSTLATCPQTGQRVSSANGELYNGMVLPYVNMSLRGYIWYQGENNVGEGPMVPAPPGSPKGAVGHMIATPYTCMLPAMMKLWRSAWAALPSTTPPDAIFGVVGLASGTDEGHKYNMPFFRHAQTGGYGVLPNPAMPNSFFASGYDIGDPWDSHCAERSVNGSKPPSCCRASWFSPIDPTRCNVPASKARATWNWDDTNYYMGPIHPRPKLWVGKRLAAGAHAMGYNGSGPVSGPVLASCAVSADGKSIRIHFNASLARGDTISVGPYNRTAIASGMEVLVNGTTKTGKGGPIINGLWVPVQISTGSVANTIEVDISALHANGTAVQGVRYAWSANPCCDGVYGFTKGDAPCPMASCPLKLSKSSLVAMPFMAHLKGSTCTCAPPQFCG